MATQIGLPFEWPADPSETFVVTDSNARAAYLLEHWAAWPVMTAVLCGPRKSGRSLLARVFVAKTGGAMIDDAEARAETELFHAWNRAQATRRPLVLVADAPPPEWAVRLPDLRSRLAASPVARIDPPDDALMTALLRLQFLRHGLDAREDLIGWLGARIERSHIAVMRTVDVLDQAVLERRRRLTVALAREVLADAGLIGEHE